MGADEQYQKTIDLAVSLARSSTREDIFNGCWMPFQLLYVEMVKRKELTPISELDEETKKRYWKEVNEREPQAKRYKLIWLVQSLYVFENITSK